jgi:hypothetical protein
VNGVKKLRCRYCYWIKSALREMVVYLMVEPMLTLHKRGPGFDPNTEKRKKTANFLNPILFFFLKAD